MTDGLVVMRGQPLHYGHIRLIDESLKLCRNTYIVLGSIQESGTSRNPFEFEERKKMIKNYYTSPQIKPDIWNRLLVIGLEDIFSLEWPNYVLDSIIDNFPDAEITDIFGGSEYDCNWFKDYDLTFHIIDRSDIKYPFVAASMIRDMIMYKDKRWMDYVPECNWQIVAKKFNRLDMLNITPNIPMMSMLASNSSVMHVKGISKIAKAKRNKV